MFINTPFLIFNAVVFFNESNYRKCVKRKEKLGLKHMLWVSVSKKNKMSKCDCIQTHTCSRMCSHMHSSLDPSVNLVTQWCLRPNTKHMSKLVWSQHQNGTILCHSVWCRRRSQMTGNHKTNVIPFSKALCLNY